MVESTDFLLNNNNITYPYFLMENTYTRIYFYKKFIFYDILYCLDK